MDLEDEGEGRRHGGRVLCGSGGNKKGGHEEDNGWRVGLYSVESRHGAWRDSVVPKHVARLSLPRHPPHRAGSYAT